jgi:hypothetical protein
MKLIYDTKRFTDLHERLPRFAEITGELVEALGLEKTGGRGPKAEPASDRLIRDYVRRRVLSPTLRGSDSAGRGFYGFRHLVEFLAARVLLNDGWPLEKIAERNTGATTEDLLSLIPGQSEENEALALARSLRDASKDRPNIAEDSPLNFRRGHGEDSLLTTPSASAWSSDRNIVTTRRRAELPMLMRQITGDGAPPSVRRRITLEFGDRLTLLIDQDWLQQMSIADADAIGRTVSAALFDYPNLLRGRGSK